MDNLAEQIAELKKARNAVILAHNYERDEVQDIADFTGDSLELARKAATVEADVIVFCGVYFMAETAAILNPRKTVLIPDPTAGCPMADMITGEQLRALKAQHPGAAAVCYVNSTAEVKAECDICVTSGNAEKVMAQFPKDREILFVPDQHLGSHIADKFGVKYVLWPGYCPTHARLTAKQIADARAAHPGATVMVHPECTREVRDAADQRDTTYVLWPGYCPTHARLTAKQIAAARAAHPGATVMVHPECPREVRDAADQRLSTGGMCAYARRSSDTEFIVGTELGILHRLRKENPGKNFYPAAELVCPNMKKTTLDKVRDSLANLETRVTVPEDIATRARRAIEAMLAVV